MVNNDQSLPSSELNNLESCSLNGDMINNGIRFDRHKRYRRTANEIERRFVCWCGKAYGSEGSLNQHKKLKGHLGSINNYSVNVLWTIFY